MAKRQKEYRISDLQAMAEQLGASLRIEMLPVEARVCEGCRRAEEAVDIMVKFTSGFCLCDKCVAQCSVVIADHRAKRLDEAQSGGSPEAVQPANQESE